ncbi:hypothetical protein M758_3G076400 [Ceratodon purpureus]|uniref:Uncharacterized protein n=1 Tax=Ceratodon purpureus TaxID=3225 RepID=A0A8T0IJM1_CERPU|nr:hypothetical protein KC19_3G075400 [Ceratodon purpureus]KAG0622164.1 hypothetical protein M758_3G076400 [Ceratodon purpureus]
MPMKHSGFSLKIIPCQASEVSVGESWTQLLQRSRRQHQCSKLQ